MKRKDIQWFLEPNSDFHNENIYLNLIATHRTPDGFGEIIDSNGQKHEVWSVDFDFIRYLLSQRVMLKIYLKQGDAVQRWRLFEPSIRKRKKYLRFVKKTKKEE